ncbi:MULTISPECIES: TetR/AcrR family transcriptional regulator [Psychrilyobacter]|uniref:TetR family transcriptional regulator n=1 Tax=Psychrilyobacter piezotolerans TaxID=2293438 RepID=A0ABX9KD10_9FUSO|nr:MULTISPECIES: TetR/AcrR family transcriptional regulator [Psychrilyobacter]MCS5422783.1 TetR/AcrR family transcriptional regulator [Psychrilyobacter sp. S5]NDI79209.1 TetR/AcrR family transcriptional regulator [Psychrilyobacter piezotolerans]RDE58861.1 TetR/AcrR family transcriptional regulator [Psychrilyobacter sp. S5]REI39367.1 TetR family transcriptional regulator [Psychrilyobacter piezotolerans]
MTRLERKLNVKRLFIDATMTIIQEEGLEEVSIRKVAKITGYNSATLYTYFKNLDHLILLASIKFLNEYITGLDGYTAEAENSLEQGILIWEFFCKCSFQKPEIYKSIFFSNLDFNRKDFENYYEIKEFYKIYPEEITTSFSKFHRMILKLDIYERNKILLIKIARERLISPSNITAINDMQVLIYKGLLEEATKPENFYRRKVLCNRAIKYIKSTYKLYTLKECRLLK